MNDTTYSDTSDGARKPYGCKTKESLSYPDKGIARSDDSNGS